MVEPSLLQKVKGFVVSHRALAGGYVPSTDNKATVFRSFCRMCQRLHDQYEIDLDNPSHPEGELKFPIIEVCSNCMMPNNDF